MDRRSQDELLEVLDALRQQVGPAGLIVPLGSVRYRPSAVLVSGFVYPLELVARAFADPETGYIDLSSPRVLVHDGLLVESAQLRLGLAPVLEKVMGDKAHRALAVLATDLDGIVLDALVSSHKRNLCAIAAVGCAGMEPGTAGHYLLTIARMCGAGVVNTTAKEPIAWPEALGSARRILADRHRIVIIEPARADQANMPAQPIGLLSVGGTDAADVREGLEWIEGLLGH